MHKIFVNDKPIILSTDTTQEEGFENYPLSKVKLAKVIKKLNSTDIQGVKLIGKKKSKLLKKFLKKRPNVVAGGGKVYNPNGDILFIYRNDKWDLPKGKIEKKEAIEDCAIREVEEETGVKGLRIVKPLETTYHIFKRNGRYKIKITYWFEMTTDYEGSLNPENSEGITKAKWLTPKQTKKALKNSYANIKQLI